MVSNLLSGVFGALLGSLMAWLLQRNTQNWSLRAELKRHRVARVTKAAEVLRACFFQGLTELEYHLLALEGIEWEKRSVYQIEAMDRKEDSERVRYNDRISRVESEARAHAELLPGTFVPAEVVERLREEMKLLIGSSTTDAESVRGRIGLFNSRTSSIMAILSEVDALAESEISRPV